MNPADQKKRFRVFAKQLENGIPPTEEQTQYLIHLFRGIGTGRDPARILGLSYENGKSKEDARKDFIILSEIIIIKLWSDTSYLEENDNALINYIDQ